MEIIIEHIGRSLLNIYQFCNGITDQILHVDIVQSIMLDKIASHSSFSGGWWPKDNYSYRPKLSPRFIFLYDGVDIVRKWRIEMPAYPLENVNGIDI